MRRRATRSIATYRTDSQKAVYYKLSSTPSLATPARSSGSARRARPSVVARAAAVTESKSARPRGAKGSPMAASIGARQTPPTQQPIERSLRSELDRRVGVDARRQPLARRLRVDDSDRASEDAAARKLDGALRARGGAAWLRWMVVWGVCVVRGHIRADAPRRDGAAWPSRPRTASVTHSPRSHTALSHAQPSGQHSPRSPHSLGHTALGHAPRAHLDRESRAADERGRALGQQRLEPVDHLVPTAVQ